MTDLAEILRELRELRVIVGSLQPCVPPRSLCEGVTGKGTACRNRAIGESSCCRMHGVRSERPPKPARAPKVAKKPKKIQPEHAHGIGEACEACPLCDTHGDVWDPGLPEYKFCA